MLDEILAHWIATGDAIVPTPTPSPRFPTISRPSSNSPPPAQASKVFANEMLHGAPRLRRYLSRELRHG